MTRTYFSSESPETQAKPPAPPLSCSNLPSPNLCSRLMVLLLVLTPFVGAAINLRGLRSDLSSKHDRFVPLDINGDRKTDLLYYRPGGGYAGVYVSLSDGRFRYVRYSEPGKRFNGFSGDVSDSRDTAVPLDVNGDGKSDFLWYRPGSGYASLCLSKGAAVSCDALSEPGARYKGFLNDVSDERDRAVALDLNGDGRSDFLWFRPGSGWAHMYLSKADGSLQALTYSQPNQQSHGFEDTVRDGRERVLPLDLNGDGRSDFLWYVPGGGLARAYLSRGDGSVQGLVYSLSGHRFNGFTGDVSDPRDTAVALDLNGDRRSDFLWYRPGSGWALAYLSNGNGTVRALEYSRPGSRSLGFAGDVSDERDTAVALDLNGDGKDDFLWYRPGAGFAGVHLSKGDGSLTYVAFSTRGNASNGFASDLMDPRDTAVPVNLNGNSMTGFVLYRPGGGRFQAYTPDPSKFDSPQQVALTHYSYAGNTATWMGDLSYLISKMPLKGIAMPGTHDSAMYPGMPDADLVKNQRLDFYDQMVAGARWFDFRFGYIEPDAPTRYGRFPDDKFAKSATGNFVETAPKGLLMYGHSDWIVDVSVAKALEQIRQFLEEHPTEIAILSMRPAISGKRGDWTDHTASVLKANLRDLIYDRPSACMAGGGAWDSTQAYCSGNYVSPQDVTPEMLWRLGKRVILLDENSTRLTRTAEVWRASNYQTQSGYKAETNGIANSELQIEYMTKEIVGRRGSFLPADAAPTLLQLNGALTPYGEGPCLHLCGFGPIPLARAFNPKLKETLRSRVWNRFALNIISIDNIGEGATAEAIIATNNQSWLNRRANVIDAAVGGDGSVWVVDADNSIHRLAPGSDAWERMPGGASRIAVDPKGVAWVVNASGQIYRYRGTTQWELMPGSASDIAIGADGTVWITGATAISDEGSSISKWTGQGWTMAAGEATRIAVDSDGKPWIVTGSGKVLRYNPSLPSGWENVALPTTSSHLGFTTAGNHEYSARDIAAGGDGSIWYAGDRSLWRFNGTGWDPWRIDANTVAVGPDGNPWVIRADTGQLYSGVID